ncbi:biotin--[acetyl-CoA-carboxylase] ligase [Helicobacter sp. 13S00401-1]|uniref:biotin--[acetyl-CoA-carboxylase] ligase n=1 Tax=Helicobacter sp. 13S00401-1 TaxID=1905758 RepID=UPI000BA7839E|nr:biotin--[acetyl-CoA-carboxylase] ligase [Helicobacter sp. 13S00401-1]PAF50290.1 biotin--[acetyl-CoA-carboxylase] ligase [Helicobacter sp. 13S00401-1]
MRIRYFSSIPSTQVKLLEDIKTGTIKKRAFYLSFNQTNGIGSRGNAWQNVQNGIYFSFCTKLKHLDPSIPTSSFSIYMGRLLLRAVLRFNKDVWLKWPNDFYLGDKKVGGLISQKTSEFLVIGLGLNIKDASFEGLGLSKKDSINLVIGLLKEVGLKDTSLIETLLSKDAPTSFDIESKSNKLVFLEEKNSWKDIFSKYKLEFSRNRAFNAHSKNEVLSLKDSILLDDGSIKIGQDIYYSMR